MNVIEFFSEILKTNKDFDKTQINRYIGYFLEQTKNGDLILKDCLCERKRIFEDHIEYLITKGADGENYETSSQYGWSDMEAETEYDEDDEIIKTTVNTTENFYDRNDDSGKSFLFSLEGLKLCEIENKNQALFFKGRAICVDNNNKYGIVDKFGKVLLEPTYDFIDSLRFENYLVATKEEKYGVIDFDGKVVLPLIYDLILFESDAEMAHDYFQIHGYAYDYLLLFKNEKIGLINAQLKPILPIEYKNIYSLQKESSHRKDEVYFILENEASKFCLFQPKTNYFTPFDWDEVYTRGFSYNIPFRRGNHYGFYQLKSGKEFILDFEFDLVAFEDRSKRYIQIKNKAEDRYAVFDTDFNRLTEFVFDSPVDLRDRYSVHLFAAASPLNYTPKSTISIEEFFRKYGIK